MYYLPSYNFKEIPTAQSVFYINHMVISNMYTPHNILIKMSDFLI